MIFSRPTRSRPRGFNLTPMIDVVFQLVIFFLFTAQFGELTHTEIDLPRQPGERNESSSKPTFVLDIDDRGQLFAQSEPISVEAFAALVSREIDRLGSPDSISVRVRPDRNSPAADLNRVTRRVAELGVSKWSIATIAPDGKTQP